MKLWRDPVVPPPMRLWNVRLGFDRSYYKSDINIGVEAETAEEAMEIAKVCGLPANCKNPFVWSVGHRGVIDIPAKEEQ